MNTKWYYVISLLWQMAHSYAPWSDFCFLLSTVVSSNYNCEQHSVQTTDGYKLQIFRIPSIKGETQLSSKVIKPAIAFVHDAFESADDLINPLNFNGDPLALIAVQMGFDVWCLNTRGNKYSSHITLSNKSKEFFSYSWQQKGEFDITSAITYIQQQTGVYKVALWTSGQTATGVLLAAAINSFYKDNVSTVIVNNPCFIIKSTSDELYKYALDHQQELQSAYYNTGIYALCSQTWDQDS